MRPRATVRSSLGLVCTLALCAFGVQTASAQETGRITGQVRSAQDMRPLEGAQVSVEGTGMGGLANAQGRFLLLNVPAGTYNVRVTMIGFATARQQVTVASGQVATADFSLDETALALDEIVVTGTAAEVRAKEVGNSLDAVTSREIENIPTLKNSEDILAGRAPGVTVMTNSGQPGAGSTVKIRGINTISQTMQPLIYVDGVRIYNEPTRAELGRPGGDHAAAGHLGEGHRAHRGHQGRRGDDAVRHRGLGRRDPDLHEAGHHRRADVDGGGQPGLQPAGVVPGQSGPGPDGPVHEVRQPREPVLAEPAGLGDTSSSLGDKIYMQDPTCPSDGNWQQLGAIGNYSLSRARRPGRRHVLPLGQLQRRERHAADAELEGRRVPRQLRLRADGEPELPAQLGLHAAQHALGGGRQQRRRLPAQRGPRLRRTT